MFDDELVQNQLGQEMLLYLKRKRRGGDSNERGSNFEIFYAVYQIALHTPYTNEESIFIASQVIAFLDDLVIHNETQNRYKFCQLKNTRKLSWSEQLQKDFQSQKTLNDNSIGKANKCSLVIVVSTEEAKAAMENSIPDSMPPETCVESFEFYGDFNKLLSKSTEFRVAIEKICAFNDQDKLEALAATIVGAWVSTATGQFIPLHELLDAVNNMNDSNYLAMSGEVPDLSPELKQILGSIPHLGYNVSKGHFIWTVLPSDKGHCGRIDSDRFKKFEQRVINNRPRTFDEFEELLP